jgi:hypothetical protein
LEQAHGELLKLMADPDTQGTPEHEAAQALLADLVMPE